MAMKMKHSNPEMLLRIAQGDAYALAIEYVKRSEHNELFEELLKFEKYHKHPVYNLNAGCVSDDTQMSCAVAECLLETGVGASADDYVRWFFDCFKRDPRDGYSRGFQSILEDAKTPDHLKTLIRNDSNKNGAAMRAVPIGVIKDPKKVIEVAGLQAATTHQTYGGINSAAAVALMSHYALYDRRDFSSMLKWCASWLPIFETFKEPWRGPVSGKIDKRGMGLITAHAVSTLLQEHDSLIEIMKQIIEWGGDTDSTGAIAWGIASCRFKDELPEFFEHELESRGNLKYGAAYLRDLGQRLMKMYE